MDSKSCNTVLCRRSSLPPSGYDTAICNSKTANIADVTFLPALRGLRKAGLRPGLESDAKYKQIAISTRHPEQLTLNNLRRSVQ